MLSERAQAVAKIELVYKIGHLSLRLWSFVILFHFQEMGRSVSWGVY
jgi:hypothetical protein